MKTHQMPCWILWPSGNWTALAVPMQITHLWQEIEMHGKDNLSYMELHENNYSQVPIVG